MASACVSPSSASKSTSQKSQRMLFGNPSIGAW